MYTSATHVPNHMCHPIHSCRPVLSCWNNWRILYNCKEDHYIPTCGKLPILSLVDIWNIIIYVRTLTTPPPPSVCHCALHWAVGVWWLPLGTSHRWSPHSHSLWLPPHYLPRHLPTLPRLCRRDTWVHGEWWVCLWGLMRCGVAKA